VRRPGTITAPPTALHASPGLASAATRIKMIKEINVIKMIKEIKEIKMITA
jgi:hypothetical protein